MTFALVLGSGGLAGIAWELGVLRGIADVDEQLADQVLAADLVIGTSAGSTVAAQITSGATLSALYDQQLASMPGEIDVQLDLAEFGARLAEAVGQPSDDLERRRRIGAFALNADTVPEASRRTAIEARLPVTKWPERDVRIPAVDAATGEVVVFTPEGEVDLIDAVAASCAVPGIWPPVSIGANRYVDGGVRSSSNADLATGADRVLVIMPLLPGQPGARGDLSAELASLAPARTCAVLADSKSIDAFGTNPLSPTTRGPSARAGREVGREQLEAIRALLTPT